MSEYTKIQWHFEADRFNNPEHEDKLGAIVDEEDFIVAEVCSDAPNALSSARIIAAAPELLEALKEAQAQLYKLGVRMGHIEAAIAKAEGK